MKSYLKLVRIVVFLLLTFATQAQDMQQLLDLKHNDSIIGQIRIKDSSTYTAQDHFQIGMLEVTNGNYKKALGHFEKSESLGTENINRLELAYFMGRSEAGLGNFRRSYSYFEQLLKKGVDVNIIMMTPESSFEIYRTYRPLLITYGLNFEFWDYLFLAISIIGFAFALFLIFFFSKRNRQVIYMGLFILAFSINILEYVLYWTNYILYSPVRNLYLVLFFLYPPLLYLYIKNNIDLDQSHPVFSKKNNLHFLLFYLLLSLVFIYYMAYPNEDLEFFFQAVVRILFDPWLKLIYVAFYLVLIVKTIKGKLSSMNLYLKRWIILLTLFYLFMIASYFLPGLFSWYGFFNEELEYFFSLMYAVFLFMCGVMIVIQPEVFLGSSLTKSLKNTVKYKNSGLTESMSNELQKKLDGLLENERIFMQSELNLIGLADQLNIDRYSMSQVINEGFGKGFYELINEYRIKEAKKMLLNTNKNIGDVIFEVGFNNHASFYKAFKKHMKTTPSQFIAEYRKN